MSALSDYLESKKKLAPQQEQTPLQKVLTAKGWSPKPIEPVPIDSVGQTPKQTPKQTPNESLTNQQNQGNQQNQQNQELLEELRTIRQEMKLMQDAFLNQNIETNENEDDQKKKIDDSFNADDTTKIREEIVEPAENPFNSQEMLPQIYDKLRIPKENQELLLKILGGALDSITSEEELSELLQTTVTQHPILTRSTQYKPVAGDSNSQRARKPDVSKMSMSERNKVFAKRLNEIV